MRWPLELLADQAGGWSGRASIPSSGSPADSPACIATRYPITTAPSCHADKAEIGPRTGGATRFHEILCAKSGRFDLTEPSREPVEGNQFLDRHARPHQ